MFPLEFWCRIEQYPLLPVRDVPFMLTAEHAFYSATTVVPGDLLYHLGDIPVLRANLDCPHRELRCLVGRADDVCCKSIAFRRKMDRLRMRDGETIELDPEHDLHHIIVLQNNLWVGRQGREMGNDVVDGNGGGKC